MLWACSRARSPWEDGRREVPTGCRAQLGREAPEERLRQGVQGCKYQVGDVRKEWGSFPDGLGEEMGFLKFWGWGMVGKGRRVHQPFSDGFCRRVWVLMSSVLHCSPCS